MGQITAFLTGVRRITKLYEGMLEDICRRYRLTRMEANIISFLQNNPGKDTAGDIVELRMFSKSAVSQGVEALIQKALVQRKQDPDDRRKIHLSLLPKAKPITEEIETIRKRFTERVFAGFSGAERELFAELSGRIVENVMMNSATGGCP